MFLRDFKKVLTLKKGGGAETLVGSGWEVVLFRLVIVLLKQKTDQCRFLPIFFFLF